MVWSIPEKDTVKKGKGIKMVFTDKYEAYIVKFDTRWSTVEVLDARTNESIVFMQGEDAWYFEEEYKKIPPQFMQYHLSQYDYRNS